jgi:superfamily II DNA or RNA helicase
MDLKRKCYRLKNIKFKTHYISFEDNIANDFLIPALKNANSYRRAVGYFSVSSLEILAEGLDKIVENNGKVHFIVSPELNDNDIAKIKSGYLLKDEDAIEILSDKLTGESVLKNPFSLDLVSNMIAEGILEIKIAFMKNGIFHEKIGEISNNLGERICFNGSMNETFSGYEINTESITVFNNWTPGISQYSEGITQRIDRLWMNEAKGVTVIDFPEVLKSNLIKKYRLSSSLDEALMKYKESKIAPQVKEEKSKYGSLELYDYQKKAIKEFEKYNYQHFYEMATGTGKTFTAIRSIEAVEKAKGPVYVTVVVPSIDLQVQWYEEFEKAGYKNVHMLGGYKSNSNWKYEFERSLIEYEDQDTSQDQSVVYIAVSDSYFDKMVSEVSIIENYMIIIDEAHELSPGKIKKLPKSAKYRLGLSATPERHNKDEINLILKYFLTSNQGSYKYTIEEAISTGALTKYNYYPIPVELTEEEYQQYKKFSRDIMIEMNKKVKDENKITRLMNERSLIVKKASNKVEVLSELIRKDNSLFKNSVIYCGAGKSNNEEELTILHEVTRALYRNGNLKVSNYTSKTENRKEVLDQFESDFFDTLVAIKCFDQGVDVPKLEKIHLLASDSIMRQTVQRRGRVLRKCKETGKRLAYIYDYVALPPSYLPYENTMSTLLKNELYRVEEYLRLSSNKAEVETIIEKWKMEYPIDKEEKMNDERLEHY